MSVTKPNKQINNEVHEMTDEEFAELLASGWVPEEDAPTLEQ